MRIFTSYLFSRVRSLQLLRPGDRGTRANEVWFSPDLQDGHAQLYIRVGGAMGTARVQFIPDYCCFGSRNFPICSTNAETRVSAHISQHHAIACLVVSTPHGHPLAQGASPAGSLHSRRSHSSTLYLPEYYMLHTRNITVQHDSA